MEVNLLRNPFKTKTSDYCKPRPTSSVERAALEESQIRQLAVGMMWLQVQYWDEKKWQRNCEMKQGMCFSEFAAVPKQGTKRRLTFSKVLTSIHTRGRSASQRALSLHPNLPTVDTSFPP